MSISIWLIHHKASLSECSPMNLDGSEYMTGIGVVPATDMQEAIRLFNIYLQTQGMGLLEVWKCEQYIPTDFAEQSQANREINEAARDAIENNQIFYVLGISSEAWSCGTSR